MTDDNDKPTAAEERSIIADRILGLQSLGVAHVAPDPADFDVSLGPEVPDLATARDHPDVVRARQSLAAAAGELGLANGVIALTEAIADLLGLDIHN